MTFPLAACGDDGGGGGSGEAGEDETIGVSLITKTSTNPFFVTMQKGAEEEAEANNIDLTLAAGKEDGDETTADAGLNGDEEPTGIYSGGSGGGYEIVCNEPTNGAEDEGRTAMENCLTINGDINVVYAINEPAAIGANNALEAAGMNGDVIVVSVDGGCAGVDAVASGVIGATSQQYPLDMASKGVEAIDSIARGGEAPETTEGLDFFDTGAKLVTDAPVEGVESIDTTEGTELCWG
ncbi:MAG: substrate-binding domain-containing protein [Ornithinimicrobium sp.]